MKGPFVHGANIVRTVTKTGRYSLRIMNVVGCESAATDIDVVLGSSSVQANANVGGLKITYSPELYIECTSLVPHQLQIEIIDVLGRTVSEIYRGIASGTVRILFPADLPYY